jgi:hypothetical protein
VGAKAAIHVVGKFVAVAKPATSKPHPDVEPPPAAKSHPAAKPPTIAQPDDVGAVENLTVNLVALFNDYTAELDDGSNVLVKAHDVTVVVNHRKGIQVVDLIGKFNEKLLLGSHQKARYCWYNRRIQDFTNIDINSQPNLDMAMKKYGMFKQVMFH